jgi:hypothetical protein
MTSGKHKALQLSQPSPLLLKALKTPLDRAYVAYRGAVVTGV